MDKPVSRRMKPPSDFSDFAQRIKKVAVSTAPTGIGRYQSRSLPAMNDYTVETIRAIIRNGTPSELEQLSLSFYRSSGIYTHMINYLSNLLLYDTIVIPKVDPAARVAKSTILKKFGSATDFIDNLDIAITFTRITKLMLIHGVYYGLVRDFGGKSILIQDLPTQFCRSAYKSENGIDILEFDLGYFNSIYDTDERNAALAAFPPEIAQAYDEYKKDHSKKWFEVPEHLGVVFSDIDQIPYLIASLPTSLMYDEAQDDERKRDKQELEKLLIIQMPIGTNGEPVFDLDETVALHQGVADMLSDADYVNVLTTFGEAKLEDAQDSTQASRDKLAQYKRAVYDVIGSSSLLFNAEGNIALEYSVNRDTSVMLQFAEKYANWLTYQVNRRFAGQGVTFDIEILPTTIYNREKMANLYLNGAQYGYSKFYAGAALGIKQSNLVSLVGFENDVLNLDERLVPLMSSHTQSAKGDTQKKSSAKSGEDAQAGDTKNEGGRPALPETAKDDKTIANKQNG